MTIVTQSALREVRDQLMVDTADGTYLNNVGQNLGLQRPPIGFIDADWRAIVKLLGIEYKQIKSKFEAILGVLFGPKTTVTSVFTQALSIGDTFGVLASTKDFPQVGTIVIDKGMATEETVDYDFIDRYSNRIFFTTPLTFAHTAQSAEADATLLLPTLVGATSLVVSNINYFDNLTVPFSVGIDLGTEFEEFVECTAVDYSSRTLTVDPTTFAHAAGSPTVVQTVLKYDYTLNSFLLSLEDSSKFPETGTIIASSPPLFTTVSGTVTTVTTDFGLYNSGQHVGRTIVFLGNVTPALANVARTITSTSPNMFTFAAVGSAPAAGDVFYVVNTLAASAGTVNDVTVASPLFGAGDHVGNRITFVGNITAALANVSVDIDANTTTTISFITALGSAPAVGDLFYISPRVSYTRNSYTDNALILTSNASGLALPKGTLIEVLSSNAHVYSAQAAFVGINWDVIQSDPRHVEIFLPESLNINDIRTASYIHEGEPTPVATTLAANATLGDTTVSVNTTVGFPVVGVFTLNAVNYGYTIPLESQTFVLVGSTNLVLQTSPGGMAVNSFSTVYINDIAYSVASNTANTITLTHQLKNHVFNALVDSSTILEYYSPDTLLLTSDTLQANALIGDAVSLYISAYGSGLVHGDLWDYDDVFPGPYVYDVTKNISYNLDNITTITGKLAGPTRVVVDQNNFNSALEVSDASFFPFSGYPYDMRLGATTGNLETVSLLDVNLKQRTSSTIANPSLAGAAYIEVVSLGAAGGSRFPNSRGYRVLVGRGTVNEEVIYATSTDGAAVPPRIYCEPTVNPHAPAETVELMADVLSTAGLSDVHAGYISFIERNVRWPTSISSDSILRSETVELMHEQISVVSTTGLDPVGGTLIINPYGMAVSVLQKLTASQAPGANPIVLPSTAALPVTGYPYPITVGFDTFNQEIVLVTNNDGINTLTLLTAIRFPHAVGDKVAYIPGVEESINYSTIVGNTIRFSSPIVLKSDHYIGESVIGTKSAASILKSNGYDFPLRMPTDPSLRLRYLIDLVRAAGVQVSVIYAR